MLGSPVDIAIIAGLILIATLRQSRLYLRVWLRLNSTAIKCGATKIECRIFLCFPEFSL
jgi:hypothetical protein